MAVRGVQAALQAEGVKPGEQIEEALKDAEQDDLFAEDMRAQALALEGCVPKAWDGVGRKPGARNKATQRVVDFILNQGRDPLIFWSSVISMGVDDVKQRFGFETRAEAAEFQRKCAADLAPYVHSRKPLAVELDAPGVDNVTLVFTAEGHAPPAIDGDAGRGDVIDAPCEDVTQEVLEKQRLNGSGGTDLAHSDPRTGDASD